MSLIDRIRRAVGDPVEQACRAKLWDAGDDFLRGGGAPLFHVREPAIAQLPIGGTVVRQSSKADRPRGAIAASEVDAMVGRGLQLKADALSMVPFIVEERRSSADEEWGRPTSESGLALQRLVNQPNPTMSLGDWLVRASVHLDVVGASFTEKVIVDRETQRHPGAELPGTVLELWTLTPYPWEVKAQRGQGITEFAWKGQSGAGLQQGTKRTWTRNEILFVRRYSLADEHLGRGSLEITLDAALAHIDALRWNRNAFANNAILSGVFTSESLGYDAGDKRRLQQVEERLAQKFGGVHNARRVRALGGDWKYQQLGTTPVDMDYTEGRRAMTEEIAAGLGLHPALLVPDAKYANGETAVRLLWKTEIVGRARMLATEMGLGLVRHFGPSDRIRLRPDFSAIEELQDDLKNMVEIFARLLGVGVPYNDALRVSKLDLPALEEPLGTEPYGVSLSDAVALAGAAGLPTAHIHTRPRERVGWSRPPTAKAATTPGERLRKKQFDLREKWSRRAGRWFRDALKEAKAAGEDAKQEIEKLFERGEATTSALLTLLGRDTLESELRGAHERMREISVAAGRNAERFVEAEVGKKVDSEQVEELIEEAERVHFEIAVAEALGATERGVDASLSALNDFDLDPSEAASWLLGTWALTARAVRLLAKLFGRQVENAGKAQAFKTLEKASRRLLRRRGNTIGQQETQSAVWRGDLSAITAGIDQGAVSTARKTWLDADDDRVCPRCIGLDDQEVDAADDFVSTFDQWAGPTPPAHFEYPCRCGVVWVIA